MVKSLICFSAFFPQPPTKPKKYAINIPLKP